MSFENKPETNKFSAGRRKFLKNGGVALLGLTTAGTLAACGSSPTQATGQGNAATATPQSTTAPANPTTASTSATTAPVTASTTRPPQATTAASQASPTAGQSKDVAPAGFTMVGPVSSYKADSSPVAFKSTKVSGFVYNKAGQYLVFSDICTHQGCEVTYVAANKLFNCPCHNSQFDITGAVTKGPATTRLPEFEAKVVGETLFAKLS